LAFSAVLVQDEQLGRRRELRWRVRLDVRCHSGVRDGQLLDVTDLSKSGFLLETSEPLKTGACLVVEIPGGIMKSCKVVWSSGRLHGATFADPLTDCELRELTSSALRAWPSTSGVLQSASTDLVSPAVVLDEKFRIEEAGERLPLPTRLRIIFGLSIASWAIIGTGTWLAVG